MQNVVILVQHHRCSDHGSKSRDPFVGIGRVSPIQGRCGHFRTLTIIIIRKATTDCANPTVLWPKFSPKPPPQPLAVFLLLLCPDFPKIGSFIRTSVFFLSLSLRRPLFLTPISIISSDPDPRKRASITVQLYRLPAATSLCMRTVHKIRSVAISGTGELEPRADVGLVAASKKEVCR